MIDPAAPAGIHVRAVALVLSQGRDAGVEDFKASLAEFDCAPPPTPAVLDGGRRTFDQVGRERPRLAA
jgi:hypothetical protein